MNRTFNGLRGVFGRWSFFCFNSFLRLSIIVALWFVDLITTPFLQQSCPHAFLLLHMWLHGLLFGPSIWGSIWDGSEQNDKLKIASLNRTADRSDVEKVRAAKTGAGFFLAKWIKLELVCEMPSKKFTKNSIIIQKFIHWIPGYIFATFRENSMEIPRIHNFQFFLWISFNVNIALLKKLLIFLIFNSRPFRRSGTPWLLFPSNTS